MTAPTDQSCAGVPGSFEGLYRAEFDSMVQLAHLLTGSNDAAEDVAHEAFLRVRDRVAGLSNPVGYLRATVVNLSKNWRRARSRRLVREQRTSVRHVVGAEQGEVGEHDELLALIDGLPFRQRAVLVARYWLDLPEVEIAELVGCRPGTVKSLNARALAALRKELE